MQQTDASRFLERAADSPWSWSDANCLTLLGDWVDARRGLDVGAAWKARGLDEAGARRQVAKAGGLLEFMRRETKAAGLTEIVPQEARDGDIGLVTVATIVDDQVVTVEIGALRCSEMWGARTLNGVMMARCEAKAAWRV